MKAHVSVFRTTQSTILVTAQRRTCGYTERTGKGC